MSEFQKLGLSPKLTEALEHAGFTRPTPIQAQSIPLALDGRDILGIAQTGTGKTLAFGLPMVERLLAATVTPDPKSVMALVLVPTRELAQQITDNLAPLVRGSRLQICSVVGGKSINRQITMLGRGTDILIATPGRLIDLMDRGAVRLSTVRYLVLDEADQMLDIGFIHALRKIAAKLGTPRQTMLFSATMSKQMDELSRSYLNNPKRVQVASHGQTADKVEQFVHFIDKAEKPARLRAILSVDETASTLVYSRTKHGAEKMMKQLVADGYRAASIHGNKSQGQRERAIREFRDGQINILVATDVAARGLDIPDVGCVINYDIPHVAESYVHRIGRTARAGRAGKAISLCSPEDRSYIRDIEKLVGRSFGGPAPTGGRGPDKPRPSAAEAEPRPSQKKRRRGRKSGKPRAPVKLQNAANASGDDARAGLDRMLGKSGRRVEDTAA